MRLLDLIVVPRNICREFDGAAKIGLRLRQPLGIEVHLSQVEKGVRVPGIQLNGMLQVLFGFRIPVITCFYLAQRRVSQEVFRRDCQLLFELRLCFLQRLLVLARRQQRRSHAIVRTRIMRVFRDYFPEFRHCPRRKVRVPISSAELHMKCGTVFDRRFNPIKDPHGTLLVIKVQTDNSEIVFGLEAGIERGGRFQLLPRILIPVHPVQCAPQNLVSPGQACWVVRVVIQKRSGQGLRALQVPRLQRHHCEVPEHRQRVRSQRQSFVKKR